LLGTDDKIMRTFRGCFSRFVFLFWVTRVAAFTGWHLTTRRFSFVPRAILLSSRD